MRSLLTEMIAENDRPTIVDIEAGLEHLSRGTARSVDTMLVIFEPYFKSMETGARMTALARELGIPRVLGVANKVTPADEKDLAAFCLSRDMELAATIPRDEVMATADRNGSGPLDVSSSSPAIDAIGKLAERLKADG
ncbi:MAG TPA: hypothetical protein VNM92_12335 [Thermoanaerobaculia bacterium]|nr:hypothetical protein [Thermoanaerobaculia bacterium]